MKTVCVILSLFLQLLMECSDRCEIGSVDLESFEDVHDKRDEVMSSTTIGKCQYLYKLF